MTTLLRSFAFAAGLAAVSGGMAQAQDQQKPVAQAAAPAQPARERDLASIVSLKVKIVLSKYQGEKKISSLPYELTVRTDNGNSNIRMGTQVPVPSFGAPKPPADASAKAPASLGAFSYKELGTNIDCRAANLDSGRFALSVTIEDSSVYPADQHASQVEGVPAFRSFRAMNSLVMRDGQSAEFTVATDKVSGEVIKAEITISVVK